MMLRHYPRIVGAPLAQIDLRRQRKNPTHGVVVGAHDNTPLMRWRSDGAYASRASHLTRYAPAALCLRRRSLAHRSLHIVKSRALHLDAALTHRRCMNAIIPADRPKKERPLNRKVSRAVEMLINGEARTIKAAAEAVGLSREHVSKSLRSSRGQAFIEQRTRETLSQSRVPAAATLLRLLDQAKSEHVQKDVATTLLAINGHRPPDRNGPVINVGVSVGYVIDLSSPRDGAPHVINATVSGAPDE